MKNNYNREQIALLMEDLDFSDNPVSNVDMGDDRLSDYENDGYESNGDFDQANMRIAINYLDSIGDDDLALNILKAAIEQRSNNQDDFIGRLGDAMSENPHAPIELDNDMSLSRRYNPSAGA